MAKRLTEEMVIARTKISDLSKIKRLNCWGSELSDVTLLRRMPCVEVLSLSINKISSLEDFQYCKRLEELFIRQNEIRDLNQVCYLQNLTNLKNLWLGENACSNIEGYRWTVLRALPQLQKLDNVAVTPEELKEAQRKGKLLQHPDSWEPSDEDVFQTTRNQEYSNEPEYSPQRISPKQEAPRRHEPVRRNYSPEPEYVERRRNSYERETSPQQQYYDEYTNGERYSQQQAQNFRHEPSELGYPHENVQKRERHTCPASYRPPLNRRPVTRNSNILSAVLCLVKELDYPSLEVVEMAVRCRMDELDE